MVLARTTKLEAVNKALQMMGEAPLNSLQGLFGLGNLAETTINSVSRKVQTEGWSFNTDYQVSLVRDSITNHISVGDNVSRVVVDPYDYPDYDVVQRGQKLYDRKNNTEVNGRTAAHTRETVTEIRGKEIPSRSGISGEIEVGIGNFRQPAIATAVGLLDLARPPCSPPHLRLALVQTFDRPAGVVLNGSTLTQ